MKSPQKGILKDLYSDLHNDLVQQFAGRNPVIECKIKRSGVNWHCTVKQGENLCCISCFDLIYSSQYLISFQRNSEEIALGRTSSKLDVIHAVDDWVNGSELTVLYDKFPFVDRYKRAILGIRNDLVANLPELSELVKPIRKEGYDWKLRAGTSMWNLCLSRSRSHGNMGLYSLVFQVEYDNLEIDGEQKKSQSLRIVYLDNGAIAEEFVEKEIALTDRIRELLQKLSEQPIYL